MSNSNLKLHWYFNLIFYGAVIYPPIITASYYLYIDYRELTTINIVFVIFMLMGTLVQFTIFYLGVYLWIPTNIIKSNMVVPEIQYTFETVDIIITRYREPLDILIETLTSLSLLTYPSDKIKVFVLDDGHSEDCELLVQRFNQLLNFELNYVSRPDNSNAKAGNINYTLPNLTSRYLAILDCDCCPIPEYLDILVSNFQSQSQSQNWETSVSSRAPTANQNKLAFIQTPQEFRNISYNSDYLDMSNQFFTRIIMPAMSYINIAPYIGTNALFDREILSSIGGFHYGHSTEDVDTGLSLHLNGYISKYVDIPVAYGLAPEELSETFEQRLRWVLGSIQLLLNRGKTLIKSDQLNIFQKISYIQLTYYWTGFIVVLIGTLWNIYNEWYLTFTRDICLTTIGFRFSFNFYIIYCLIVILLAKTQSPNRNLIIRAKIRAFQMYINYAIVFLYSFLAFVFPSHFKNISTSLAKNGQTKNTHPLIYFNYFIYCLTVISILCKTVIAINVSCIEFHLSLFVIELLLVTFIYYPSLRKGICCLI